MMVHNKYKKTAVVIILVQFITACGLPALVQKTENTTVPEAYNNSLDSTNSADISWKTFFIDKNLIALIDTALNNNQELNMILQEVDISNNEVRSRKGEYLPSMSVGAGGGVDKVGRYTRNGALEANNDIKPGKEFPEPLPDLMLGATFSWEIDIWNKLHNAKKAAVFNYLSSIEGKNFMVTNLVTEIATSYYELMALDNQLEIITQNIEIQKRALHIVQLQKQAAKVTELAVKKFEAEVLKNQSLRFYVEQQIIVTENRINQLTGRFPQEVKRNSADFNKLLPDSIYSGIPSQLLDNRPDVRQAELELEAAKLNIKVAKANFYPSLSLNAGIGLQAFDPTYFLKTPESLIYSITGDLIAPLINRNAIKARYLNANAKQIQAIYKYEQTILNAYVEVVNQLSNISNLDKSYDYKALQVKALRESIDISTNLFKSARADYMEVLMTQRDALEARIELIETKNQQMNAFVKMYQALGGGWK